jgi:hypothetical protein
MKQWLFAIAVVAFVLVSAHSLCAQADLAGNRHPAMRRRLQDIHAGKVGSGGLDPKVSRTYSVRRGRSGGDFN